MSSSILTINPISVSQIGTNWSNIINALPNDSGAYATNASGFGALVFTLPATDLPPGTQIVGVEVDLNWGIVASGPPSIPSPPTTVDLATQWFQSGSSFSSQYEVTFGNGWSGFQVQSMGGSIDLWGASWNYAAFNSGLMTFQVWRPNQVNEGTGGPRLLESAVVKLYLTMSTYPRIKDLQRSRISFETTPGTFATPTIELKSTKFAVNPKNVATEVALAGQLAPGKVYQSEQASEIDISGELTYDEIGYLLKNLISPPTSITLATGVNQHTFEINPYAQSGCPTLSLEQGDVNIAETSTYIRTTDFDIQSTRPKITMKGKGTGQIMNEAQTPTVGAGQVLTLGLTATGGNLVLNYLGAKTTPIAVSGITASAIQTALQALATVGAGNMLVGGATPTFTITNAAALAGQTLAQVEVDASSTLTGGTATITLTTPGGLTTLSNIPVQPGQVSVFYATSFAGLALTANKLLNVFETDINVSGRYKPVWTQNASNLSWAEAMEAVPGLNGKITVQADNIAAGISNDSAQSNLVFLRWQATGPQIASSGINRSITIDQAIYVKEAQAFKDEDGTIFAREFATQARIDSASGILFQVTLVNDVAGY